MSYAGMDGDDRWTVDGGTCKPVDFTQRAVFKDLQVQTNRLASRLGTAQGTTTGDIDPPTVAAVNAILSKSLLLKAKLFKWSFADCNEIAAKAEQIAAAFKAEASQPIRLETTVVETSPAPSSPASSSSPLLAKLKTPLGLAAAGVGAIVLISIFSGRTTKPAKRAPSARGYKRRVVKRVGRQRVTTTYY
jgi:hypothetical protein